MLWPMDSWQSEAGAMVTIMMPSVEFLHRVPCRWMAVSLKQWPIQNLELEWESSGAMMQLV